MDISQQYIDMSREATELQDEGRYWLLGDCYAECIEQWYVSLFIGNACHPVASDGTPMINWVWLPRQDQLQAIIDFEIVSRDDIHRLAEHFELDDYVTWEHFWLAFVMKEKFNKHWNGTTWEASNERDSLQSMGQD